MMSGGLFSRPPSTSQANTNNNNANNPNVCADSNSMICMTKRDKCGSPVWDNMCKKTCGKCPGASSVNSSCADKNPAMCKMMASKCDSNPAAKMMCPVTCGVCQAPASSLSSFNKDSNNPYATLLASMQSKQQQKQPNNSPFSKLTQSSAPANSQDCKDEMGQACLMMAKKCDNFVVASKCAKTCGKCKSAAVTLNPMMSMLAGQNKNMMSSFCKDQNPTVCKQMRSKCSDSKIKMICAETCGQCNKMQSSLSLGGNSMNNNSAKCEDTKSICVSMKQFCENPIISKQCPMTCGSCSKDDGEHSAMSANPMMSMLASLTGKQPSSSAMPGISMPSMSSNNKLTDMLKQVQSLQAMMPPKNSNSRPKPTPTFKPLIQSKGDQGCVDLMPSCGKMADQCFTNTLKAMCPQTCGVCAENANNNIQPTESSIKPFQQFTPRPLNNAVVSMPAPTQPTISQPVCQDQEPELCATAGDMCEIPDVAQKCQKTCNQCPKITVTPPQQRITEKAEVEQKCGDRNPACPMMKTMCSNKAIAEVCLESCGKCGDTEKKCRDFDSSYCTTLSEDDCKIPVLSEKCPFSCGTCIQGDKSSQISKSASPKIVCKDNSKSCQGLENHCGQDYVKNMCPLTCKQCEVDADSIGSDKIVIGSDKIVTAATEIVDTRPQPLCEDQSPLCDVLAADCSSNEEIRKTCPKSCNSCPTLPPLVVTTEAAPKEPVCKDTSTFCSLLKDQCHDPAVSGICQNTCDACEKQIEAPITTTQKPTEVPCKDFNAGFCSGYKEKCYLESVKKMCPSTCEACDWLATSTKAPVTTPSTPESEKVPEKNEKDSNCKDLLTSAQCTMFKEKGHCSKSNVSSMCKNTCQACSDDSEQEESCVDISSKCSIFKQMNQCHTSYISNACKVTCGVCVPQTTTTEVTTTETATVETNNQKEETKKDQPSEFVCKDQSSACKSMAKAGMCGPNYKDLCTLSCNFCELAKIEFDQNQEKEREKQENEKLEIVECFDLVPEVCTYEKFAKDLERYCSSRHFRPNCQKSCSKWHPCTKQSVQGGFDKPENPSSEGGDDETEGEHSWKPSTSGTTYINRNPITTAWGQWSACSTSCGGGIRKRTRVCRNMGARTNNIQPETCGVPLEDTGVCSKDACLEDINDSTLATDNDAFTRPKSCCTRLTVMSHEPKRSQQGRYGQYELVEEGTYNNRSVYRTANTMDGIPEYMYWMNLRRGGMWLIGPELGKGGGGLLVRIPQSERLVCPNEAAMGAWRYYSVTDGWQQDTSLTVICDDTPMCKDHNTCDQIMGDNTLACRDPSVLHACPIKCNKCNPAWSTWSSWSECSAECQEADQPMAVQKRTRECHAGWKIKPSNETEGEYYCSQGNTEDRSIEETRDCQNKIEPCSDQQWAEWSECSISCRDNPSSRGTRTRTAVDAQEGDKPVEEICGSELPICAYWNEWSACSIDCRQDETSVGTQSRYSEHLNETEVRSCGSDFDLCNDIWHSWSNCSISCRENITHSGTQTRYRKDDNLKIETRACGIDLEICQEWSICTMPCGGGEQVRNGVVRACNTQSCDEMLAEEEPEIEEEDNDLGYTITMWSEWTECSSVCNGLASRTRTCASEKPDGCSEVSLIENQECNIKSSCLTEWSDWTICSTTCNTETSKGVTTRSRDCLGLHETCINENLDEQKFCNLPACIQAEWDQWTEWSDCSCLLKTQERTRNCINGVPGNGGCMGEFKESQECNCDDTGSLDELFANTDPLESIQNNPPVDEDSGTLDSFFTENKNVEQSQEQPNENEFEIEEASEDQSEGNLDSFGLPDEFNWMTNSEESDSEEEDEIPEPQPNFEISELEIETEESGSDEEINSDSGSLDSFNVLEATAQLLDQQEEQETDKIETEEDIEIIDESSQVEVVEIAEEEGSGIGQPDKNYDEPQVLNPMVVEKLPQIEDIEAEFEESGEEEANEEEEEEVTTSAPNESSLDSEKQKDLLNQFQQVFEQADQLMSNSFIDDSSIEDSDNTTILEIESINDDNLTEGVFEDNGLLPMPIEVEGSGQDS